MEKIDALNQENQQLKSNLEELLNKLSLNDQEKKKQESYQHSLTNKLKKLQEENARLNTELEKR